MKHIIAGIWLLCVLSAGLGWAHSARQPAAAGTEHPLALVDGKGIYWPQLQTALAEAAGGAVLQEAILDLRLEAEMTKRGQALAPDAPQRERVLLERTIAGSTGPIAAGPDQVQRLITDLRRTRGLGEQRFASLLHRNAMLRALVADQVTVDQLTLEQGFAMMHGPQVQARIIVAVTQAQAAEIRKSVVEAGPGGQGALRFAEAAFNKSTDASRERGGIIAPFSTADPSMPTALRLAAKATAAGQVSEIVGLERGFALLWIDAVIPGDGKALEDVKAEVTAEVRLREERVLMDRLARRLLAETGVTVFDRAMNWSWQATFGDAK